jgi:hypothetical protein
MISGVASSFGSLRIARHEADYDHLAVFSKARALAAVADAERGIQQLGAAQEEEKEAFATLLALNTRIR